MESTGLIKTQHEICQVMVGGAICGNRMKMPQASTTGPRNYLKYMHPKIWVEMEAIVKAKSQVKRGAQLILAEALDIIKGEKVKMYIEIEKIVRIQIINSL